MPHNSTLYSTIAASLVDNYRLERRERHDNWEPARRDGGFGISFLGVCMAWVILVLAGLFEIGWAIGLKYTDGFTRLWPSIGTVLAMVISVTMLGVAMKSLPVGTAYAVWVGVGAVGTAILGMVLFGEAANAGRIASLVLIIVGIVGLKLATPA